MAQARSISTDKIEQKSNMTHGVLAPNAGAIELRIADLELWENFGELENRIKKMLEALREDMNGGVGGVRRGEGPGHFKV